MNRLEPVESVLHGNLQFVLERSVLVVQASSWSASYVTGHECHMARLSWVLARLEACVYAYEAATLLSLTQHQCDRHGDDDAPVPEAMIQQLSQESDCGGVYDNVHAWHSYDVHDHWDRARPRSSHAHGHHYVSFPECDGLGFHAGEAGHGGHQDVCALWCDDALEAARCETHGGGGHHGESVLSHGDLVAPGGLDHFVGARDDLRGTVVPVPVRTEDSLCVDGCDGRLLLGERVPCGGGLHDDRYEGGTNPFAGAPPHGDHHKKMDNAPFAHTFQYKIRRRWATPDGSYS